MPQNNSINVQVFTEDDEYAFKGVHYVSFVSSPGGQGEGTYGIPAKLSDREVKAEGLPVKVLYVNPANIVSMLAERVS